MIDPVNLDKLIADINTATDECAKLLEGVPVGAEMDENDYTWKTTEAVHVLRQGARLRYAYSKAHAKLRVFEEARDRFLSGVLDEPEPEELLEVED